MAVNFAIAGTGVVGAQRVVPAHAVRLADGKLDRAAAVQRTRENLRVVCAVLREARQACTLEVNCVVHRNGRGLQAVQVVFGNAFDHRVVAVGLPGNRKFGEILSCG